MKLKALIATIWCLAASAAFAQPSHPPDIAEIVSHGPIPMFATFSSILHTAGMDETVAGREVYTLLAPTEDAFKLLPAKALAKLKSDPKLAKEFISDLLLPGAYDLSSKSMSWAAGGKALGNGPHKLKSISGSTVVVAVAADGTPSFNGIAPPAEWKTPWNLTNGRIYALSKVLLQPRLAKKLK